MNFLLLFTSFDAFSFWVSHTLATHSQRELLFKPALDLPLKKQQHLRIAGFVPKFEGLFMTHLLNS